MASGPIRRAQLIAPFGTGAMITVRDGTSLISAGLDHWFKREDGDPDSRSIDPNEYVVEEWRLQKQLQVDHFRLPPDFRKNIRGQSVPNCNLTIPFLRFPQWHYCPGCYRLYYLPLTVRGRVKCSACSKRYLVQVPFVAVCELGHIQDIPFREWVHESLDPPCQKQLYLVSTGGASLAAMYVKCDCGASRPLANITSASGDGTFLTKNLSAKDGEYFLCQGKMPWHGTDRGTKCGQHLRGSLRSASNVYYAQVRSAIYLPQSTERAPSDLITLLKEPPLSTLLCMIASVGADITPQRLREMHRELLAEYNDAQIRSALKAVLQPDTTSKIVTVEGDDRETAFRRAEYNVLKRDRTEDMLSIKPADLDQYKGEVTRYFSRIMLIDKLRETRVLTGFTRIFPQNDTDINYQKALLWKSPPKPGKSWLPAYIVFGEGIFLELDENQLQEWEKRDAVIERVQPLIERYRHIQLERRLYVRSLSPRFILVHTLAHLLINQLTFECGYSSAALRERIYVSDNVQAPMGGILIYTAAGDSEGTMGGLVRMGKPGYLEPVLRRAIENAFWCSADPVCMELGARGGQGPDSCNLAACHNCALIPETACEEFNRFLDRALVTGTHEQPIGFFSSLLESRRR